MADTPRLITADELEQLTPNERAAIVNERSHTRLDDLPNDFREKVTATAHRLANQRYPHRHA